MPTPGERRALIFIASVAALGVATRGWMELHRQDAGPLAGNRSALARQIEAVDSAIAVSSSKRKPRAAKSGQLRPEPAPAPASRAARARTRARAAPDSGPGDPREAYRRRSLFFDSLRTALEGAPGGRLAGSGVRSRARERVDDNARRPSVRANAPPVDLDVAPLQDVASVPLIGEALARRIVSDRIERGPYGTLAGLERIPGITAAFTRRLAPYVTFSLSPRHAGAGSTPRSATRRRPGGALRP